MFLAEILTTIVKMIIMGAFAFGGIQLGRVLRKRKNEKLLREGEL